MTKKLLVFAIIMVLTVALAAPIFAQATAGNPSQQQVLMLYSLVSQTMSDLNVYILGSGNAIAIKDFIHAQAHFKGATIAINNGAWGVANGELHRVIFFINDALLNIGG